MISKYMSNADESNFDEELKYITKDMKKCIAENRQGDAIARAVQSGSIEKRELVHKALGYSKNIVQYTNKRELGLFNPHQLPTTTDVASHSVSIRKDEHGRTVFEHHTEAVKESYEELLMDMKPEEVTLGRMSNGIYSIVNEDKEIHPGDYDFRYSDDQKECFYQQGGHVYNLVSKNDNGSFVVMNPYNSNFLHTISKEKLGSYTSFTHVPIK